MRWGLRRGDNADGRGCPRVTPGACNEVIVWLFAID